jgi:hypothetical protein
LRSGQSMSRMAVLDVGIEVAIRLPESNVGLRAGSFLAPLGVPIKCIII